jgi:hypothetical protein
MVRIALPSDSFSSSFAARRSKVWFREADSYLCGLLLNTALAARGTQVYRGMFPLRHGARVRREAMWDCDRVFAKLTPIQGRQICNTSYATLKRERRLPLPRSLRALHCLPKLGLWAL